MIEELTGPPRDGTSQAGRARAELAPGYVRLDERTPADLIAFVQAYAARLRWYGPDGAAAGDWGAMFDGLAATPGPGVVSHAEAAAFLADPGAFADPRLATLRRPHMMLLLACVQLLRHGQDAINAILDRHYDHQLRGQLALTPAPARPPRAFVLFDLASGAEAVEAPAGLRLLAGRDANRHDRVFRLDERLVVTRARVRRIATTFVDREVVDLAAACRASRAGSDERLRAALGLAYGSPKPGDPMPPLDGAPVTARRWTGIARLLAFAPTVLHLSFAELRALAEGKRRRGGEVADWGEINRTLERAGSLVRDEPGWRFQPDDPRAFEANVVAVYRRDPMVNNGLEEVDTLDDVFLRLDRPEVAAFVRAELRIEPDVFAAMMARKRALDADWRLIRFYLTTAGQRRTGRPDWTLPATIAPTDFAGAFEAALGVVAWNEVGPEGAGAGDLRAYLDRVAALEEWFLLPAEKIVRLLPLLDLAGPADRRWPAIAALLSEAHAARVLATEVAAMRAQRQVGIDAALAAATGEPATASGLVDALARWLPAERVGLVRAAREKPGTIDAVAWDRVDAALAEARRRRLALPAPVPRREHWHALWADAFDPPAGIADARPGFGAQPADRAAVPAALGWAIASPALALSAGRRRVTVTLVFAEDDGGALVDVGVPGAPAPPPPFDVEIGTEGAWLAPADVRFAERRLVDPADPARPEADRRRLALTITFALDAAQSAVPVPRDGAPMLRATLRGRCDGHRTITAYERYRTLRLLRVELRAEIGGEGAEGLWPLDFETDEGEVDGKRPFEPFGGTAPPGASLAIGHPDLAGKRLSSLALRWQWQAPPADLTTHYQNYPDRRFEASLALVGGGAPPVVIAQKLDLFGRDTAAVTRTAELPVAAAASVGLDREPRSPDDRGRRLRLTLGGTGFGHAAYPSLALRNAADLTAAMQKKAAADMKAVVEKKETTAADVDPARYIVRPPYTPRLQHLSLDLVAVHLVDLTRYDRAAATDRVYHLHPFGAVEAPDAPAAGWPLVPAYDEEGALYIGLDRVEAPATLSLLIDTIASGDGGDRPTGLRWTYLDADGWTDFVDPPRDTTLALARSGLVRLTLPAAAPDPRMPGGLYWVRATVAAGARAAGAIAGLHAQAGTATLVEGDADGAVLPAGTIRAIADAAPGLAKVTQPHPSFDGAPAEDEATFRLRAAEQLRHKGRAVTAWDYERLVLARFPAVHKVKCLPATMADGPGLVRLVVVPDVRALRLADPFAPRAPAALLDDIVAYLIPLAPAVARIEARHPHFVRVRVRLAVRFRDPGDEAFQKRRLTDAINRHLAPWAFGGGEEIVLGQRIDAAALVAFVDGLPFVDFVAGCRLFQADEGEDYRPGAVGQGEAAASDRADALLVPATGHEIDVIADAALGEPRFAGIGHMKIGLDLIVAANQQREDR